MWRTLEINSQNIKARTEKAVLIKCPNKSQYAGYSFWHPAKLVKEGSNSYANEIVYNENFKFKLLKYGQGRYNSREIIDSIEIDYEELENAFSNTNIVEKSKETYLNVKEPEKLDGDVEIKEEFKNE